MKNPLNQSILKQDHEVVNFLLSDNNKLENFFLKESSYGGYLVGYTFENNRSIWWNIESMDFHDRVVNFLIKSNTKIIKNE